MGWPSIAILWSGAVAVSSFIIWVCNTCITESVKRHAGDLAANIFKHFQQYYLKQMFSPKWYWNYVKTSCIGYRSVRFVIENSNPEVTRLLPHQRVEQILSSWLPQEELNTTDHTTHNKDGAGDILLRDINNMQLDEITKDAICYYSYSLNIESDVLWWEIFVAVLAKSRSVLQLKTEYFDLIEMYIYPLFLWKYFDETRQTVSPTMRRNMVDIITFTLEMHSTWLYNQPEFWKCSALGPKRFEWLLDIPVNNGLIDKAFSDVMRTTIWNEITPEHETFLTALQFAKPVDVNNPLVIEGSINVTCTHIWNILRNCDITNVNTSIGVCTFLHKLLDHTPNIEFQKLSRKIEYNRMIINMIAPYCRNVCDQYNREGRIDLDTRKRFFAALLLLNRHELAIGTTTPAFVITIPPLPYNAKVIP